MPRSLRGGLEKGLRGVGRTFRESKELEMDVQLGKLLSGPMVEIGRRLRLARQARGKAMREVGLPTSTIGALEQGRRATRFETVLAYADALGVSVGDLVAGLPDVKDVELRETWRRAA